MPGKHQPAKLLIEKQADMEQARLLSPADKLKAKREPVSLLKEPKRWVEQLSRSYSWKLVAMVSITSFLLKGFVAGGGDEGLIGKPAEFLFADLGVTAGRLQVLKAAAIVPWSLKPVVALLSDCFPCGGYRKMPYVLITTFISCVALSMLGLGWATTEHAIVACLFLAFLQVATVDVLMAAKQSEEVKAKAELGPEFMTFTWLGINIGQIASVCVLGPLIAGFGPEMPYLLAAPLVLLVLWPAFGNFLGEKRVTDEEIAEKGFFTIPRQHPTLCMLTFMTGMLALSLVVSTFIIPEENLVHIAVLFAAISMASFIVFIRWEITGPIVWFFLLGFLSFNIDGAMFYFCTDSPEEFPLGPHFSVHFYATGIGAAIFIGITAGYISGAEIFRGCSYRRICATTVMLRCLTQMALVPVLRRWNLLMGIPDHVWLLTVVMLDWMVQAWRWIPKQIMAVHLAPKGVEATTLGLHAGTFNMASILSSYCGGYILSHYGITPEGSLREGREFEHLWKAQVAAAFAPLILIALIPFLIPAKEQTEALLTDHEDSATHNSFFERLRNRGRVE